MLIFCSYVVFFLGEGQYPKNHGISELGVWRSLNPAIQIQTPQKEGPMILRVFKKTQRPPSRFRPKARRRIDAILVAAFAISSIQPEGRALWEVGELA